MTVLPPPGSAEGSSQAVRGARAADDAAVEGQAAAPVRGVE